MGTSNDDYHDIDEKDLKVCVEKFAIEKGKKNKQNDCDEKTQPNGVLKWIYEIFKGGKRVAGWNYQHRRETEIA